MYLYIVIAMLRVRAAAVVAVVTNTTRGMYVRTPMNFCKTYQLPWAQGLRLARKISGYMLPDISNTMSTSRPSIARPKLVALSTKLAHISCQMLATPCQKLDVILSPETGHGIMPRIWASMPEPGHEIVPRFWARNRAHHVTMALRPGSVAYII